MYNFDIDFKLHNQMQYFSSYSNVDALKPSQQPGKLCLLFWARVPSEILPSTV